MELWNELRTAMVVARSGTVSAASIELGVHRATVMRHVDALEAAFGSKLFLRHSRGYTLTEAGEGCCQSNANPSLAASRVGALIQPEVGAIRRGRRFSSI